VSSTGLATAVWYRWNGSEDIIQSSTSQNGGAWSTPIDLSATGQDAYDPEVTVSSTGLVTAVWYRWNGSSDIIQSSTLQASAAAPLPTLPIGDVLKVLSYYNPKQVASVNVTTGVGTVDPAATGFSTLVGAEGAGFELSTQKTWLLDVDCTLWSLNNDGTTTVEFDLFVTTETEIAGLEECLALMLNQDGTAYITADVNNENAEAIFQVSLSDGSLVGGSVTNTPFYIGGMSTDPSTGFVWVSAIYTHDPNYPPGLWRINLGTGQPDSNYQILPSVYNNEQPWDIAFDSSGRLWMLTWGEDSSLVSIDPDAPDPEETFFSVGYVLRSGDNVSLGSDAIWIPGVRTTPTTPAATLANTGAEVELLALGSFIAVVAGAGFFALGRGRRTQ
jgi:hypothetical protein